MTKEEVRKEIREKRKALTDSSCRRAGRTIAGAILEDRFRLMLTAQTFCIYMSHTKEVSTGSLRRHLLGIEKNVAVPIWDPVFKQYDLSMLLPGMPFVQGPMGIREPAERIPVHPFDVDVFVMPGLAFDYTGGRIGYGGGYYDRILKGTNRTAVKLAIAFDFQVYSTPLPQEEHDFKVDYIFTEKRIVNCRKVNNA